MEIKRVLKNVFLTQCKLVPVAFTPVPGTNYRRVTRAKLFVEGYILQCIEYIIEEGTFCENVYQLMQSIVLELVVQILQEQEVRVEIT